jgi:hypothetical protein
VKNKNMTIKIHRRLENVKGTAKKTGYRRNNEPRGTIPEGKGAG